MFKYLKWIIYPFSETNKNTATASPWTNSWPKTESPSTKFYNRMHSSSSSKTAIPRSSHSTSTTHIAWNTINCRPSHPISPKSAIHKTKNDHLSTYRHMKISLCCLWGSVLWCPPYLWYVSPVWTFSLGGEDNGRCGGRSKWLDAQGSCSELRNQKWRKNPKIKNSKKKCPITNSFAIPLLWRRS